MTELIMSVRENLDSLNSAIRKRYDISIERAKAEYAYRSLLGKEMAYAKAEGMAATSLYDYCRGYETVAKLRMERDILIAKEKYLDEMILYYRTEIRVAERQIDAERRGL